MAEVTEPEALRIHELPRDVALIILARRGYTGDRAEEQLAISRGENMDDVIYEYGDEGKDLDED